ncbi:hypothetical protein YC2023_116592 [Brassica napus]
MKARGEITRLTRVFFVSSVTPLGDVCSVASSGNVSVGGSRRRLLSRWLSSTRRSSVSVVLLKSKGKRLFMHVLDYPYSCSDRLFLCVVCWLSANLSRGGFCGRRFPSVSHLKSKGKQVLMQCYACDV